LLSDFPELILYLGLYINTDLFPSVPEFSSLPIFLDVFGVTLPVLLQVVRVLAQPFLDARIIMPAAVRVFPSPTGIGLGFTGFLTGGGSAGLLAATYTGMRMEGTLAVGAISLFHPGPLSGLESKESNQPQELEDQDEKKKRIIFSPWNKRN
jgi:hypothetical protein